VATARRDFDKIAEWRLSEAETVLSEPIDQWKRAMAQAVITRPTAKAQIDSARYMLLSVVVIAGASLLAWLWPNPLHFH
jgi:hypothetical protein